MKFDKYNERGEDCNSLGPCVPRRYHTTLCEDYERLKACRVELAKTKRHVEKLREQNANLLRKLMEEINNRKYWAEKYRSATWGD